MIFQTPPKDEAISKKTLEWFYCFE
jgi:hypothetical protein